MIVLVVTAIEIINGQTIENKNKSKNDLKQDKCGRCRGGIRFCYFLAFFFSLPLAFGRGRVPRIMPHMTTL